MHALSYTPTGLLILLFAWSMLPLTYAGYYFVISTPAKGIQWSNNAVNPIEWSKGLLDGVTVVDVELARMSTDGLIYVARDVPLPSSTGSLNVFIQDVPTGDDYYLLFLDSVHGVLYATSQRFAIADTGNGTAPSPAIGAATVTVSGGPNPTVGFATTFPASANGVSATSAVDGARTQLLALTSAVMVCLVGGAWTVL